MLAPDEQLLCGWKPGPGRSEGVLSLMVDGVSRAVVECKLVQHEVNRWKFLVFMKYGDLTVSVEDAMVGGYAEAVAHGEGLMLDMLAMVSHPRPWGVLSPIAPIEEGVCNG